MLNEEQLQAEVTITGGTSWLLLQCVSRLAATGSIRDIEITPVGQARDALVAALQEATGVNYDQAKAQMEALQRQRMAEARAAQAQAQADAEAAETVDENPAPAAEGGDEAAA